MKKRYKKWLKKTSKQLDELLGKLLPVLMLIFVINLCFPHVAVAKGTGPIPQLPLQAGRFEYFTEADASAKSLLPKIELRNPQYTYNIWVTSYNSLPAQTDSTPCITASGFDLCKHNQENIIATNFLHLPFGTKVRFPELYGDKVFTVEDRMNKRYYGTADIWFRDHAKSKTFGKKWTVIEILPFKR